jgi:TetR/AcrR family transcriptional regulator, transcriptional repressor for nem operon
LAAFGRWRDAIIDLAEGQHRAGGCPIGSLANELSNQFDDARTRLADSFETWRENIESGLRKMQKRGELSASADPRNLALAMLAALQGGLLLTKTTRTSGALKVALDMAFEHIIRHVPENQG